MQVAQVEVAFNLIGLFAFALSGAVLAVRKQYDIVGMAVLATVTALGGGLIRDVLLGDLPPAALRNTWWMAVPLIAALLTFFFHPQVAKLRLAVQALDAVGLGIFCAAAAAKSLAFGVSPLAAVILATITGIGGGVLRDMLAGETPSVLARDSKLYAIPGVLGSIAVVSAYQLGWTGIGVQALGALGICGLRLLALWRGWTAPVPRSRAG